MEARVSKKHSKKQYLAAIAGSGGLLGEIATRLGVTIRAVQKRKADDLEIAEAIELEDSLLIGYSESALMDAVKNDKNPKVAMWILERRAKHLGYGKSMEIEGKLETTGKVNIYLPDNGRRRTEEDKQ